jgi:hypothetical protein
MRARRVITPDGDRSRLRRNGEVAPSHDTVVHRWLDSPGPDVSPTTRPDGVPHLMNAYDVIG